MTTATHDLTLPAGCTVRRQDLQSATGPLEWWRAFDSDGKFLGAGETRVQAVLSARRELDRRVRVREA